MCVCVSACMCVCVCVHASMCMCVHVRASVHIYELCQYSSEGCSYMGTKHDSIPLPPQKKKKPTSIPSIPHGTTTDSYSDLHFTSVSSKMDGGGAMAAPPPAAWADKECQTTTGPKHPPLTDKECQTTTGPKHPPLTQTNCNNTMRQKKPLWIHLVKESQDDSDQNVN